MCRMCYNIDIRVEQIKNVASPIFSEKWEVKMDKSFFEKELYYQLGLIDEMKEDDLVEVAMKADSTVASMKAVSKLNNQSNLEKVALEHPDKSVRRTAVNRIDSNKTLFEIARSDVDHDVRSDATRHISDKRMLRQIMNRSSDAELRILARMRLRSR